MRVGVSTCGLILGAALFVGCAQVGPPLPPSAQLPRPPNDFEATRLGPGLALRWTPPHLTSDGVALTAAPRYKLCVWPGDLVPPPAPQRAALRIGAAVASTRRVDAPTPPQVPSPLMAPPNVLATPAGAPLPTCPAPLLDLRPTASGTPPQVTLQATIDVGRLVSGRVSTTAPAVATVALYAASSEHHYTGQAAGWSNPVVVPLTAVPPPPTLTARVVEAGVQLAWTPVPPPGVSLHIYRQLSATPASGASQPSPNAGRSGLPASLGPPKAPVGPVRIATLAAASYLDASVDWNQTYTYWARSAAGTGNAAVESADSNQITVATRDVFPPPVPTGLQATLAAGAGAVDFSWESDTTRDLAGYNIYRLAPGATVWEKRNATLLLTPVFHDTLPADRLDAPAFRYAVTALDQTGNESARSADVTVASH